MKNCTSITNLSFSLSLIESEKSISDGTIDALKKAYHKNPEEFKRNIHSLLEEQRENFNEFMKLCHVIGIYEFIECECIIK